MNIISYNLEKFQDDNKFSNKKVATLLGYTPKQVRQMKKNNHEFTSEEITKLANLMHYTEDELTTVMNERIDLKKKKIYGTDYLFLNYRVNSFKTVKLNLVSAIIDVLFFILLAIFLFTKQIDIAGEYNKVLDIFKVIFIIELFVFPFMFFVFPYLKYYFNRIYDATLTTKLKEEYQDEACGIVLGCLRRSVNKSTFPYFFTLFSELVIALYCMFYLIYIKTIVYSYLIMIILFVVSLVISIIAFKYHFQKFGTIVKKEEVND